VGATGATGLAGGSAVIPYAPGGPFVLTANVDAVAVPTFVEFGAAHASPLVPVAFSFELDNAFVCPRAGTLTNLVVNINSAVGLPAGVHIRAVLRLSAACQSPFADTLLAVETAAGPFTSPVCLSSAPASQAVAISDAISLEFMLVADVGVSLLGVSVTVNASAGLAYT
jgi:hypothetical protein